MLPLPHAVQRAHAGAAREVEGRLMALADGMVVAVLGEAAAGERLALHGAHWTGWGGRMTLAEGMVLAVLGEEAAGKHGT